MAEPAFKLPNDDEEDSFYNAQPDRQKFGVIEGGGEGDGKAKGKLASVKDKADEAESFMNRVQDAASGEKEALDSFFKNINDEDTAMRGPGKRIRAAVRRKRNLVILGALGTILPIVGGFFALPYQLTHFSELLQQFHFSINEDTGASRTTRLIRYLRYPDSPENRRLSIIQNGIANRVENKLARSGFAPVYDSASGYLTGFDVDSENRRAIADLESEGFVRESDTDGRTRMRFDDIDNGRFNSRGRRTGTRTVFKAAGYGKLSRLHARILIDKGGVSFRPLGDLSRDRNQDLATRIRDARDRRTERRKTGVNNAVGVADIPTENADGTPRSEAEIAADRESSSNASGDLDANRNATGTPDAKINATRNRVLTGAVGGVAGVGLACTIIELDSQANNLKWLNRALPLMRIGMDLIAAGDQIKSGDGFTAEEVGVWTQEIQEAATITQTLGEGPNGETLSEEIDIGPWTNAASVRAELGQSGGEDIPDSARVSNQGTAISGISNVLDQIIPDSVCSVATNPITGIALTIASLGSITLLDAAVDAAILGAGALWLDDLVRVLAGEEVNAEAIGAELGNYANHGTRLGANSQAISTGGRELSPVETIQLESIRDENIAYENSQKSFYDRFLSPNNPRSFASLSAFSMPVGVSGFASAITSAPLSSFYNLFSPASAQESYDYGFPRFGFSSAELESQELQNPFENAEILNEAFPGDDFQELHNTLGNACFGVLITEGTAEGDPGSMSFAPDIQYWGDNGITELCEEARTEAEINLGLTENLFTRYRFYLLDNMILTSMACYEGYEQFCEELGFGAQSGTSSPAGASGTIIGDAYSPSENIPCDRRTDDLGIHEAYIDGQPIPSRLCGIPNIADSGVHSSPGNEWYVDGANGHAIVNSRVSGAWFSLAEAAANEGIILSANSSFRTYEWQDWRCRNDTQCARGIHTGIAAPGFSGHQAGVAIDFADMRGPGVLSGANCTTNRAIHDSAAYRFLVNNAASFGFIQYRAEAWHWDVLDDGTRCRGTEGIPNGFL